MRVRRHLPAALAALLGLAAPALGAAPLPQLPADEAVVATPRPTFAWTEGSSGVPIARYEVFVEVGGSAVRVADTPAGTLTARASVNLPDDGRYRWFVRLVNSSGGVASTPPEARTEVFVATTPGAPALGPVAGVAAQPASRAFSWAGDRVDSLWTLLDEAGRQVGAGASPTGSGRAVLTALLDGAYVFRVVQRNSAGVEGPPAARAFTVDATPPVPLVPVPAGDTGPFAWTGLEPGAIATWRVTEAGGAVVAGPVDTAGTGAAPGPLPPGDYAFEARQTDAAGNVGPWGTRAFRVPSGATASTTSVAVAARGTAWRRNAGRLAPAAGALVGTARPVLRWRRGPRATTLYNVQLFRVLPGDRLRKAHSAFPTGTRYALPRRVSLVPGACYVWRVWPFAGGAYSSAPLGVSDFCVRHGALGWGARKIRGEDQGRPPMRARRRGERVQP